MALVLRLDARNQAVLALGDGRVVVVRAQPCRGGVEVSIEAPPSVRVRRADRPADAAARRAWRHVPGPKAKGGGG